MAGVDGLLKVAAQSGADELRLRPDEAPRMLQRGAELRLSMPPISGGMLRELMESILTPELESSLGTLGKLVLPYTSDDGESYSVRLESRGLSGPQGTLAFEAIFRRSNTALPPLPRQPPAMPPAPAPPPAPVAPLGAPGPGRAEAGLAAPPRSGPVSRLDEGPPAPAHPSVSPPALALRASGPVHPGAIGPALASLLARAAASRASDVHLYTGEAPVLRVDGRLRTLEEMGPVDVEEWVGPLLDEAGRAGLATGRSMDRAFELPDTGRFRLNVYRAGGQLAAAVRLLPGEAPGLSELGFPVPLDDLVELPHGLVIVCGPTGSGKSTTLAALLKEGLRRRARVVITLEDPVEYVIPRGPAGGIVRQREVGVDVRDFQTGLRDALREDPDVLLIGEMRDPETITLALTAAETGHLVLTSLHSRSTASTIERIVDVYPPERQQQVRVQLADALRAVVAQRLLPRVQGGRIPAVEVLRGNHTVGSLIRDGKTAQISSAIQSSRKEGMLALERCLADLVRQGKVSREQAVASANDLASLNAYLQG